MDITFLSDSELEEIYNDNCNAELQERISKFGEEDKEDFLHCAVKVYCLKKVAEEGGPVTDRMIDKLLSYPSGSVPRQAIGDLANLDEFSPAALKRLLAELSDKEWSFKRVQERWFFYDNVCQPSRPDCRSLVNLFVSKGSSQSLWEIIPMLGVDDLEYTVALLSDDDGNEISKKSRVHGVSRIDCLYAIAYENDFSCSAEKTLRLSLIEKSIDNRLFDAAKGMLSYFDDDELLYAKGYVSEAVTAPNVSRGNRVKLGELLDCFNRYDDSKHS